MAPKKTDGKRIEKRSLRGGRRRPNNPGHSAAPSVSEIEHHVSLSPQSIRTQFAHTGPSFWNHPLAQYISRDRKVTDPTNSSQFDQCYIQNNVIGFVVRGVYRDANGIQQEVVPRRVCTKTMWRDLGVFYNSRRFAGARVRPKLSPYLFGQSSVDEKEWAHYCDTVDKAGGSPTLLVFKSLRMTLVGLPSFDGARLVSIWWARVLEQYFKQKLPDHPPISFFPTNMVLDNCVCTAYIQNKTKLNLDWIHKSVPHSNFNKALFPMLVFRFRFTIPVEYRIDKTKEETMPVVVLLSSSAKVLFTKISHPFYAVLGFHAFRRDIISPFLCDNANESVPIRADFTGIEGLKDTDLKQADNIEAGGMDSDTEQMADF